MAISGGKGKAAIANHLHDHVHHVSIRQQLQQLAGEAVVPYGAVGCCEVDKHSSGLLLAEKLSSFHQGDLVYGRAPVSKTYPVVWEQWVDDCFDTNVNESLEDSKGDTQQKYGTIALWVHQWLLLLRDRNY